MKHIKIVEQNIDVSAIQEELCRNENNWKRNLQLVRQNKIHCQPNRSKFEKDVILVGGPYNVGVTEEDHTFEDWIKLNNKYDDPSVEFRKTPMYDDYPLLFSYIHSKFPILAEKPVRMIMSKLYPGDKIQPHYDTGRMYRKNRFHFSLQGTYNYYVADEKVTISAGTLFWFDNKQYHWAENTGNDDRITVIFDVDPIYCDDLELPINSHRYLSPNGSGEKYILDSDQKSRLFLYHE